MRSIVLGLGISIDGYIARKDGSYDFLFMPKDYSMDSMAAFMKSIDTAIMGRKTWEVAKAAGGTFGPDMKGYVMSRTVKAGQQDGVTVTRQTPKALAAAIRRKRGKNIWLMGGGGVARDFLAADLVDELYLGVVPVLLGAGIPLFPAGFPQRDFKLTENLTFSKGLISLRYRRKR